MSVIERTLRTTKAGHWDIPQPANLPLGATVHILIVYEEIPAQSASSKVKPQTLAPKYAKDDFSCFTPEEQARLKRMEEIAALYPIHTCHSVEEAEEAFKRQNTPEAKAHFHKMLKRTHGALKNSKAWGKDVDVVAEIRRMRDEEWPNLWEQYEKKEVVHA
ncbi:MAG: hypothetical protein LBM77_07010 [Spirochaetaceae bacterium]|jgi:hypothetical protein|nr:hypothetical protein [Spirochaetaceae bacterium]